MWIFLLRLVRPENFKVKVFFFFALVNEADNLMSVCKHMNSQLHLRLPPLSQFIQTSRESHTWFSALDLLLPLFDVCSKRKCVNTLGDGRGGKKGGDVKLLRQKIYMYGLFILFFLSATQEGNVCYPRL